MFRFVRSWQGLALIALVVAAGVGVWWLKRPKTPEDPMAAIKAKGVIVIGARTGASPFSSLDNAHGFVGYEPDIAKALAGALGVKAKFVAVDDSNGLDFLKRSVVDLLVEPRTGADVRDAAVRVIEPGYYASGYNGIALADTSLKTWEDLKGQPVCGLQANAPAHQIIDELGGTFIGFADRTSALEALTADRCAAYISEEAGLAEILKGDVDKRFRMVFDTIDVTPWTIAGRAADTALDDFVAAKLSEYHRTGFLIERADVWQLPPNPYLQEMHQRYKQ